MRRWLVVVMLGASLTACERDVFDHGASTPAQRDAGGRTPVARPDGGRPASDQCSGEPDGARCDDWDACTPSSACRAGECIPGNAFDDCTLADSDAELVETQGEQGWFYGYWNATRDDDGSYEPSELSEMEYCGDEIWRPTGICALAEEDDAFRWTQNLDWGLQHPETMPDVELPIRRWVSDVSGPASLVIKHRVGGEYSDGTRALLLFDGREVWRNEARGGDMVGATATMPIELAVGMVIDQLVHPLAGSADDTTYFTIRIEGR